MKQSKINLLSEAGTAKLAEMSVDNAVYTEYLKFQGRIFKQKADVAMEFFAQMPETKYIATAEQWKKAGYRVKNGGRAIHFTDEDGNKHEFAWETMRTLYDKFMWGGFVRITGTVRICGNIFGKGLRNCSKCVIMKIILK